MTAHDKFLRFLTATTPNEKAIPQRQIEFAYTRIDKLVYALYGLTEEEIRIVEGG